jgi:hypothetical protein
MLKIKMMMKKKTEMKKTSKIDLRLITCYVETVVKSLKTLLYKNIRVCANTPIILPKTRKTLKI